MNVYTHRDLMLSPAVRAVEEFWAHRVLCAAIFHAALPAYTESADLEPCVNYMGCVIQHGTLSAGVRWIADVHLSAQLWIAASCTQHEKLIA